MIRYIFYISLLLYACNPEAGNNKITTKLATVDSLTAFSVDSANGIQSDILEYDAATIKGIDTKNVRPKEVVEFAKTLIGIPYKYGSTDPSVGFDCSGFITYLFQHFGIQVPRSSIDFTNVGKPIALEKSRPGDLILFTGTDSLKNYVGHMGMVVTNKNNEVAFIHSTSGKSYGVTITPFNDYYGSRYIKTIRIFPKNSW